MVGFVPWNILTSLQKYTNLKYLNVFDIFTLYWLKASAKEKCKFTLSQTLRHHCPQQNDGIVKGFVKGKYDSVL